MNWIPLLPLLSCAMTFVMCCFFWFFIRVQKIVHCIGSLVFFLSSILVFYQVIEHGMIMTALGGYAPPFGIVIVIDKLSAIMLVTTAVIALCVSIYALVDIENNQINLGFYPVYWVLLMGISGAFSTGDLFNLYVWFEVMLIASFVLMVIGQSPSHLDGAMKYVAMNLIATIFMLTGIAMLYGMTGTLNMADLSREISQNSLDHIITPIMMILIVAFGIKSALFPLFFWLPASYHTTSFSASAIFAGMLTKVGVYTLIRLTTLIDPNNHNILTLLLILAGLTMLTGVFCAASQYNFRRILSFHSISQIGYMVMGLAIYKPFALIGAIFYIVHHAIVKTNLFLISGITYRLGSSTDIRQLGNFKKIYPFLAFLFFIPAFSLAGFPPLSGFWAKFILIKAAIVNDHYLIASIALFVGFLTLFSMVKIWNHVFWKDPPPLENQHGRLTHLEKMGLYLPVAILSSISILIGLFPQFFYVFFAGAVDQVFHPVHYVHAVLGIANV